MCSLFVCLVCGLEFRWDRSLDCVYVHYQCSFEAIDVQTALHDNLQFIFLLRLNVCNDLAKAMKALDGKKDSAASGHSDHFAWVQSHFRIFCIFGSVRKVGLQLTWNASEDDCTLKFIRKGHSRFSGFFSFFQSKHLRKWWAIHTKGRL